MTNPSDAAVGGSNNNQPIHVFIAAGVRIYGEGLSESLERIDGFHVAGVRAVGPEAVTAVNELRPQVVLLDMGTPDSLSVARSLNHGDSEAPVVGLAIGESENELLACAELGITGYLTKDCSLADLVVVLRRAAQGAEQGQIICSPQLTGRIVQRFAALAADRLAMPLRAMLTVRERQIVALLERELSNKEIAQELSIEVATVKNHLHNVMRKLNVHRRVDVIRRFN